jgi:hypothetical protein
MCIRRRVDDGWYYFIANRGEKAFNGWLPISRAASRRQSRSDDSRCGVARLQRPVARRRPFTFLAPGGSTIIRTFSKRSQRLGDLLNVSTNAPVVLQESECEIHPGWTEMPAALDIGRHFLDGVGRH